MSSSYNQVKNGNVNVRFSENATGATQSSRMTATSLHLTTFNAGDIVPIYCKEILPDESISFDVDFVVRQTTLLTPTMGSMAVDFYAFFVPNRIVNQSFKAVMGENFSGTWAPTVVSLAPLVDNTVGNVQIPVGSVADYYGFPTQAPIPKALLNKCHDLKFRGYVMIYNEFFRDQNYQPPIPLRTLNVYNGFLDVGDVVSLSSDPNSANVSLTTNRGEKPTIPNGTVGAGAVAHAIYGSGTPYSDSVASFPIPNGSSSSSGISPFKAFNKPLKANKFHDYFTSTLPTPQKANYTVTAPLAGAFTIPSLRVVTSDHDFVSGHQEALHLFDVDGNTINNSLLFYNSSAASGVVGVSHSNNSSSEQGGAVYPSNLITSKSVVLPSDTELAVSIDDLRMAASIQRVYEVLGRGGSRYREIVRSFFDIEVDDPYDDIPMLLGHSRRELDLFQTAQTSGSESGNTPQGNLAAFGYTNSHVHLFDHRFIEHGYVHVFAVVRHKNIYSSYLGKDNFRTTMLDFYNRELANISEQPVFTYEVNPFNNDITDIFGYQEAWAEYRFEPDRVSGYMRPGIDQSLSLWTYADDFDSSLIVNNGNWLKSNSQEVLDRTLAVTSSQAPQFKAQFSFSVDKTLPMPTYSIPGLDIF